MGSASKIKRKNARTEVLGLELSERGVEISKCKVPLATFIAVDLFSPLAELTKYEKWATHATCSEVLEHVDDPVAFLNQAKQYLADSATLIVTVPGGKISAFDRHIGHRRHFARQAIHAVLGWAIGSVKSLKGYGSFRGYSLRSCRILRFSVN